MCSFMESAEMNMKMWKCDECGNQEDLWDRIRVLKNISDFKWQILFLLPAQNKRPILKRMVR